MNFHLNGNNDIERLKSSSTKRFSFSSSSKSASKEFPMNSTKISKDLLAKKRKMISNSFEQFDSNSSFDETTKKNSQFKRRFSRRTSTTTTTTTSDESICRDIRPPSSPVDRRCHRISSSISSTINRETCQLLGPDLCSDCFEIRLKDQIQSDFIPSNLIQDNLFQLARQSRLPSSSSSSSSSRYQISNSTKSIPFDDEEILTDEKYFQNLTKNLKRNCREREFFFRDFEDLTRKYRSNVYPRLQISETPVPKSSNEVFQKIRSDLFDVSTKYSQMKKSSRKTYPMNLNVNAPLFISPRKSEQFFSEHRFLQNSSPPLLIQSNQQRNQSNQQLTTKQSFHSSIHLSSRPKSSLIASKIHYKL